MRMSWCVLLALLLWVLAHDLPFVPTKPLLYPADAELPDSARYWGPIRAGRMHGLGELWWPNGDRYRGEFNEGLRHGFGHMVFANGDRYRGQFVDGQFSGRGRLLYSDGTRYNGQFHEGYMHGEGELRFADGTRYRGRFATGSFVHGELLGPQGHYRGGVRHGLYHGQGELTTSLGERFVGSFTDGNFNGEGEYWGPDGEHYAGEFRDYVRHGTGRLSWGEGAYYEGGFEFGLYHGYGVLAEPNRGGELTERRGQWRYGKFVATEEARAQAKATADEVLYNQIPLLDAAVEALAPGDATQIELYFVGLAGDATQDVFLKELHYIAERMNDLYTLGSRSLTLINHPSTATSTPLATREALARALKGVAARMNTQQDILFLYLTSHGSREHELSLRDRRLSLRDIAADDLKSALEASGIRWKIVVISACYSGGHIPYLQDEHSLLMTAARADRVSFGCANDADMTYFGKALFKESLTPERSFVEAFEAARDLVAQWEEADGVAEHSEPQIHVGARMAEHLQRWSKERRSARQAGGELDSAALCHTYTDSHECRAVGTPAVSTPAVGET